MASIYSQRFEGTFCLYLQFCTLKMEAADFFETLVPTYPTTWHHVQEDLNFNRETELTHCVKLAPAENNKNTITTADAKTYSNLGPRGYESVIITYP
jgi:hypothetical protein